VTLTAGVLPLERRYRPLGPLDLSATLGPHRRGRYDPCHRVGSDGAHWRTWRTPAGAATVRLAADPAAGEISTQAWGSGADWALAAVPSLLGADDDWTGLDLPPGRVRDTRRRLPGMRLSSSGRVFEALVPAILEQLVTGIEARRTWTALVSKFGDPAPGPVPVGMAVMPSAATIRAITDWEWHRIGLDGARRRTLLTAASVAPRLEEVSALAADEAMQRLMTVRGIGVWTAAEVVQRSHGAGDAVSVGDYHLPNSVGFLFTGRPRTDDAGMLALLEPYRPHRQRVVRLVEATGVAAPRYGPRMSIRDNRSL
jgi:3-methyladenine DNA glycosylase/8-oxoguanine DNA glycosylase